MEHENPKIPENINTSKVHPLKELATLSAGVIGIIVLIVVVLSLMAEKLAIYIPFSLEQQLTANFIENEASNQEKQEYIQSLTDELAALMDLPKDMSITAHYVEEDVQNAFATLGGHIFIYKGLIGMLPHENSLAMVISHEVAHIKHRHPAVAMGRGVVLALLLTAAASLDSNFLIGDIVNSAGMISMMNFSRDQERQADNSAIKTVNLHYGHVNGANELFNILIEQEDNTYMPEFLSTHPLSEERITNIAIFVEENKLSSDQSTIPLPAFSDLQLE